MILVAFGLACPCRVSKAVATLVTVVALCLVVCQKCHAAPRSRHPRCLGLKVSSFGIKDLAEVSPLGAERCPAHVREVGVLGKGR